MYLGKLISVNEFRGIKRLAREIEFPKITVLIGRNNSGKTALLEALFILTSHDKRDFLKPRQSALSEFFPVGYSKLIYFYSGKAEILGIIKDKEVKVSIFEDNRIEPLSLDNPPETLYIDAQGILLSELGRYLREKENTIVKEGLHVKVAKTISKCVDEDYTELVLKQDGWYVRREDARYVRVEDLGSGAKKAIKIMLAAELLKPKLILWDDFEVGMHPSLIRKTLEWLTQGDWQAVISTHSIDVLYHLADLSEEIEVDGKVLLLRRENDVLLHKEITFDDLETLIDSNVDPRLLVAQLKL